LFEFIYNLLLHTDIDDVESICYLNRISLKIGLETQLWMDRFVTMRLEYSLTASHPKTIGGWIYEFKVAMVSEKFARRTFHLHKNSQMKLPGDIFPLYIVNLKVKDLIGLPFPSEMHTDLTQIQPNSRVNIEFVILYEVVEPFEATIEAPVYAIGCDSSYYVGPERPCLYLFIQLIRRCYYDRRSKLMSSDGRCYVLDVTGLP